MKKVGIITLFGEYNFGNRLQNYALQEYLKKIGVMPISFKNNSYSNDIKFYNIRRIVYFLKYIKRRLCRTENYKDVKKRLTNFKEFNKLISFHPSYITAKNMNMFSDIDFFIVGSDQVWNPDCEGLNDVMTLSRIDKEKKLSYAASFGVSNLKKKSMDIVKKNIVDFKYISVRENEGKEIIEKNSSRNDVEVLIDPTMLLDAKEWEKVLKRPEQLKKEKYILNYFLGDLSIEKHNEIKKIADENNCKIINILDKNDPFYDCGPSEFLYLEKNAFLICTDSFHSSVFAVLFNRPFVIFEREDTSKENSMNSRIETLINKFKLKNRKFDGTINDKNLNNNYADAYKILEKEREKSYMFFKKAFDVEAN